MVQKIKMFLKRLHILPVTAWDIFNKAIKLSYDEEIQGTCIAIATAIQYFRVRPRRCTADEATYLYFPLHNLDSAMAFGAYAEMVRSFFCKYNGYWWPKGEWDTGRRSYLLWLAEKYKDDKRDFRKVCRESLEELKKSC